MKSKESDSYATDNWIKDLFSEWFDPCTLSDGELRSFDGLGSSWGEKSFVNPPYSNPLKWVEKAIKEHEKGKTVVLLLKHDSSTKWYQKLHEAGAKFLMIQGRLRHKTGTPAPFPSILVILNKKRREV